MFVDPRHLYIPPKEKMLSQLTITTYQNHGWLLRRKYTYTDIYIYICLQLQSLNHVLSFKEKNIFYSKKTCGDLRTKQNLPRKSLNLRKKKKKRRAAVLHVSDQTRMRCQDLNWQNILDLPHPRVVHAIPEVRWPIGGSWRSPLRIRVG